MLWLNASGQVVANDSGQPIDCDVCPCADCVECTTLGGEIQIEFLGDLDLGGTQAGCAVDCGDWAATWVLHQLSQAEVDSLSANWPTTFPATDPPRTAGCWYGLFSGLPCGAEVMTAQVVAGGGFGTLAVQITIGWTDGVRVYIYASMDIEPANTDCLSTITGNAWMIAVAFYGATPCTFLGLNANPGDLFVQMTE
jgi:hypothetical protein